MVRFFIHMPPETAIFAEEPTTLKRSSETYREIESELRSIGAAQHEIDQIARLSERYPDHEFNNFDVLLNGLGGIRNPDGYQRIAAAIAEAERQSEEHVASQMLAEGKSEEEIIEYFRKKKLETEEEEEKAPQVAGVVVKNATAQLGSLVDSRATVQTRNHVESATSRLRVEYQVESGEVDSLTAEPDSDTHHRRTAAALLRSRVNGDPPEVILGLASLLGQEQLGRRQEATLDQLLEGRQPSEDRRSDAGEPIGRQPAEDTATPESLPEAESGTETPIHQQAEHLLGAIPVGSESVVVEIVLDTGDQPESDADQNDAVEMLRAVLKRADLTPRVVEPDLADATEQAEDLIVLDETSQLRLERHADNVYAIALLPERGDDRLVALTGPEETDGHLIPIDVRGPADSRLTALDPGESDYQLGLPEPNQSALAVRGRSDGSRLSAVPEGTATNLRPRLLADHRADRPAADPIDRPQPRLSGEWQSSQEIAILESSDPDADRTNDRLHQQPQQHRPALLGETTGIPGNTVDWPAPDRDHDFDLWADSASGEDAGRPEETSLRAGESISLDHPLPGPDPDARPEQRGGSLYRIERDPGTVPLNGSRADRDRYPGRLVAGVR